MRKSHFVVAALVALVGCWSLLFAKTPQLLTVSGFTAQELHAKGEAAYNAKDYAKAIELYTEALKLEPDRHETIYSRGVNYYKLKKYDEALADFSKVKGIPKTDRHALNYIGLIHTQKKDHRPAYVAFKEASALDPKNLLYCLNAARAAASCGERADALLRYKQALQIDSKNDEAGRYVKSRHAEIDKKTAEKEDQAQGASLATQNPYGFPLVHLYRVEHSGGMGSRAIPYIDGLLELFRYCRTHNIGADKAIDYLASIGIKPSRTIPSGGDLLTLVYYNVADDSKREFWLGVDDRGAVRRFSTSLRIDR